jgi:glycosyltransferase involved in cell wall biosynthesis
MRFDNNAEAEFATAVGEQFETTALRVVARDAHPSSEADRDQSHNERSDSGRFRIHSDRPLRVMFMQTDMRIGGAEMLTANIIRRLNRDRFAPELCCLKEPGELGEGLAHEIPVHHHLLANKYDLRVWPRLTHLLRDREVDAVITVGAGDKMFWGRLAARRVGVPAVLSALHSTGWPDGVGRLNRMLTPITDSFIAVAGSHGQFLAKNLRIPEDRVAVIPNGVDTNRYAPTPDVAQIRREFGIGPTDPVLGIVAALRPEKNHELFLDVAARVVSKLPTSRFLIVGDGPCRPQIEERARQLGLSSRVVFTGSRPDVPRLLAAMDVFGLTSRMEANPLSILEAMSVGRPVVATNVGSIHEAVIEAQTGFLVEPGNADQFAARVIDLLDAPVLGHVMGAAAREIVVARWSLESMVAGYERLIETTYARKTQAAYN